MEKQIVHLFVLDSHSDWEIGHAIAVINNPAWQVHPGRYQVKTVAVSREPVKTVGGLTILPDMALNELDSSQSAMLILPGSDSWYGGEPAQALEKAKQFLAAGVPVAAICGATVGLALAGLLDETRHTGNTPDELKETGYQGATLYQDQLAFTDGNVITANGTAPVDFAYHILKKLEVYTPEMLDAWYGLFKTSDATYIFKLMEASQAMA